MKLLFKKTILVALVAAVGLASLPFVNVSAAGLNEPPVPVMQVSNERLEIIWAREKIAYQNLGAGFERSDLLVTNAQKLIDRAKSNGKDVSAVQVALDAFDAAVQNAKPIYESAKEIVNSHQGFDSSGKVTDSEKAKETVKAMGEKLKAIKDAMDGTGRALHEAIKAFREANPRPVKTPTAQP